MNISPSVEPDGWCMAGERHISWQAGLNGSRGAASCWEVVFPKTILVSHTLSHLAHHSSTTFSKKLFGPFPKMLKIKKLQEGMIFLVTLRLGHFFRFFFFCGVFSWSVVSTSRPDEPTLTGRRRLRQSISEDQPWCWNHASKRFKTQVLLWLFKKSLESWHRLCEATN